MTEPSTGDEALPKRPQDRPARMSWRRKHARRRELDDPPGRTGSAVARARSRTGHLTNSGQSSSLYRAVFTEVFGLRMTGTSGGRDPVQDSGAARLAVTRG